jgi:multisubunit Na+/H+ antiporter MnhB subunit
MKSIKIWLGIVLMAILFSPFCLAIDTNTSLQAQEVYYGALNFFSHILAPFIAFILVILVAMVIMVMGKIISKIAD